MYIQVFQKIAEILQKILIATGIKRRKNNIFVKDINIKNIQIFCKKYTIRQENFAKRLIVLKKCEKILKKWQKIAKKY